MYRDILTLSAADKSLIFCCHEVTTYIYYVEKVVDIANILTLHIYYHFLITPAAFAGTLFLLPFVCLSVCLLCWQSNSKRYGWIFILKYGNRQTTVQRRVDYIFEVGM